MLRPSDHRSAPCITPVNEYFYLLSDPVLSPCGSGPQHVALVVLAPSLRRSAHKRLQEAFGVLFDESRDLWVGGRCVGLSRPLPVVAMAPSRGPLRAPARGPPP